MGPDANLSRAGRDRLIAYACVALLLSLSWFYLAVMADAMDAMDAMDGAQHSSRWMWLMPMGAWGATEFALGFTMWAVMMVGMMLPSATPMLFAFLRVSRARPEPPSHVALAGAFMLGYLVVWTGYSLLATAVQWALHAATLLTPSMRSSSDALSSALLIVAGIYQFTPFKYACLARCRLPFAFLLAEWRDGVRGAMIMGLRHGSYCVGCCWLLMTLLFSVGVMNLLWIALLAALVLVEKAFPLGHRVARAAGVVMTVAGVWTLVQ